MRMQVGLREPDTNCTVGVRLATGESMRSVESWRFMLSQAQRTALSRYLSLVVSAGDRGVRPETRALPYESSMESSKARGDKAQRVEAYDRYVGDFSHRIRVIFSQYHATHRADLRPPADWRPAPAPRPRRPTPPARQPSGHARPLHAGCEGRSPRPKATRTSTNGTPRTETDQQEHQAAKTQQTQKIANAVGSRG